MNIEEFRDYCLSLPGVTEATPFEKFARGRMSILVFYVGGHMFCHFNVNDFSSVTIKNTTARIVELKEQYMAVGEPFNGDKHYWMSVKTDSDVNDAMLKQLVQESYELVKHRRK